MPNERLVVNVSDGTDLAELTAEHIPWTLPALQRLEDRHVDVLRELDRTELLTYVADLREDARALRVALHEALALVSRQHKQIARAARVVEFQRSQLRARHRAA